MSKKILIVNYNTTLLTQCCIKSVNKFTPGCKIYVFDNSDKEPFVNIFENVEVIDNTKGKIIDFNKWLEKYPNRKRSFGKTNDYASAKHAYTVEKALGIINDNVLLLDSDVLVKRDISDLFDNNYIYIGDVEKWQNVPRVIPYILFINYNLCKEKNVHFFNEDYMHGLYKTSAGDKYDTGANFYRETEKLKFKNIKHGDYVEHLKNASWRNTMLRKSDEWLKVNKNLWYDGEQVINKPIDKKDDNMKGVYTEYLGKLKEFSKKLGFNFNLSNPQTIQEKINWLKIYDSVPLKTRCADKVKVHDYCKEKLGKDICIPLIKTYKSTKEIKWSELPQRFVIKCNHGSGMNIIVKNKQNVNKEEIFSKLEKWLKKDFAFQFGYEMHYHDIERRILVEELKEDEKQKNSLFDYKFWCFKGIPKMYTINDGFGHGDIMYYDMDDKLMNPYNIEVHSSYKKPKNFDLMVEYAKKLSEDFKFVRVDFYEVNGEVYLGELSFTPGSGLFKYKDSKYGKIFGDWLDLSDIKNEIIVTPTKEPNKKVVYTCISGNYDTLEDPKYVNKDFDYVCFTDQNFTSDVWQIKPIPDTLSGLTTVKKQRYIKVNAHEFLPEYDFSVWVDGNIEMKSDLNNYIKNNCSEEDVVLFVGQHPQRNCIYDEAVACVKQRKDVSNIVNKQIERYKNEGFPTKYGLAQTCIIFRRHNDESCIRLMKTWWNEIEKGSHRDQLSFNYALWKNQDVKIKYLDKKIFNCETFKWGNPHRKVKPRTTSAKPVIEPKKKVIEVKIERNGGLVEEPSPKIHNLRDKVKQIRVTRNVKKFGDIDFMNQY